jgi:hypothetical protein
VGDKHFTVEEANALVPELETRFSTVMQLRSQLREAYEVLERLGETPTSESLQRTDGGPEVIRARGRFRGLMEALTEELAGIEEMGVAIKDLDIGLCDFLGEREGRDVWLCWQYGEKRVEFWHELDSGFAGRQPIGEPEGRPRGPRLLH